MVVGNNGVAQNTLSVECMQSLRRVAENFRHINGLAQELASDDVQQKWATGSNPEDLGRLRENSGRDRAYFEAVDLTKIEAVSDSLYHRRSLEKTVESLKAALEDGEVFDMWEHGVNQLLDHQRCLLMINRCEFPEWNETKAFASHILRYRNGAVDALEDIWQELEQCGWAIEVEIMWEILIRLERYVDVFERQMMPMRPWGRDPKYEHLHPLPDRNRKGKVSEAYPELVSPSYFHIELVRTSYTISAITRLSPLSQASRL